MIQKECFSSTWIEQISKELHYNDKNLIEKVIRALSLLEMLIKAGCPLVFKGGTSLMLLLKENIHRLSIDIDIICPPGTDIEKYMDTFADYGFSKVELVERKQCNDTTIPKSHSKFYYQVAYTNAINAQSYILLDVLYEDVHYLNPCLVPLESQFVKNDGGLLNVIIPSAEDILGDKLTAFAPNTTGIPYYKNGKSCAMEIAKQLYDIGRLFDTITDLRITAETFQKIAKIELSYRALSISLVQVVDDIRQTALCISTRGKEGIGDFNLIQDGIMRVKSFMYKQAYNIEDAIVDASKAAYLATSIEKGIHKIERYTGIPTSVDNIPIPSSLPSKLNKLRKNLPEAYFYWSKTGALLL